VVRIGEDAGRAALLVDGVVQSISLEDGLANGGYWAAMLPSLPPRRALILGLGGGTLARLLGARFGTSVRMVGVDDDVAIIETARAAGWLAVPNLELVVSDAFEFVKTRDQRFDYVAVDLFRGERLVAQIFGQPFLKRVRALLEPPAQVAFNMFSDRWTPGRVERLRALFEIRELKTVGGNVVVHARGRRARSA
jgi:spermidine synthase